MRRGDEGCSITPAESPHPSAPDTTPLTLSAPVQPAPSPPVQLTSQPVERANFLCHALSVETAAVNNDEVATGLNSNLERLVDWVARGEDAQTGLDIGGVQMGGLAGVGNGRKGTIMVTVGTAIKDIEAKLQQLQEEEEEEERILEKRGKGGKGGMGTRERRRVGKGWASGHIHNHPVTSLAHALG